MAVNLRAKLLTYILILTSTLMIVVSVIGFWNARKQLVEDIDSKMSVVVDN